MGSESCSSCIVEPEASEGEEGMHVEQGWRAADSAHSSRDVWPLVGCHEMHSQYPSPEHVVLNLHQSISFAFEQL